MIEVDKKHIKFSVETTSPLEKFLNEKDPDTFAKSQCSADLMSIFQFMVDAWGASMALDLITFAIQFVFEGKSPIDVLKEELDNEKGETTND